MEDKYSSFFLVDPKVYLHIHLPSFRPVALPLKHLHELYHSGQLQPSTTNSVCSGPGISVLDLGCGPVLTHAIIAAPYAHEIVMADIAEQHRKEIEKWLNNHQDAHDWTTMITHIVTQIEGQSCYQEEKDVTDRVSTLKSVIRAVVSCDVPQDPVISVPQYMKQYDVVQTFFCLESACADCEQYKLALQRVFG